MVTSITKSSIVIGIVSVVLAGCGGSAKDIRIVSAQGIVTFKGTPLKDATVIVSPEKGPVAIGVTDAQGKFTLTTGAARGAAIGKAKVSVTVPQLADSDASINLGSAPSSAADGAAYMQNMAKSQFGKTKKSNDPGKKPKALIPEKYAKPDSSGLDTTIYEDASKNNIELKLE